jgi:hypothetical protein
MGKKNNYIKILRAITEQEWVARIEKIRGKIKSEIAKIVWFDFFSIRETSEKWYGLDKYIDTPYLDYARAEIIKKLIQVGYSEKHANSRITKKREIPSSLNGNNPAGDGKGAGQTAGKTGKGNGAKRRSNSFIPLRGAGGRFTKQGVCGEIEPTAV